VTPFQRACVAAFWARINHGEASTEYTEALLEMQRQRPYGSNRRGCGRCGRAGHNSTTCGNLEAAR
jgi:hypothetical protein